MIVKNTTVPSWRRAALIGVWRDHIVRRLEDYLEDAMTAAPAIAGAIPRRRAEAAGNKRLEESEREFQREKERRRRVEALP